MDDEGEEVVMLFGFGWLVMYGGCSMSMSWYVIDR